MKERKDLKRMSAVMMNLKSPLKNGEGDAKSSTTYVEKKSVPFSPDKNIMENIAKQEKEKEAKEGIRTDMIKRGKWLSGYDSKNSAELISLQLDGKI